MNDGWPNPKKIKDRRSKIYTCACGVKFLKWQGPDQDKCHQCVFATLRTPVFSTDRTPYLYKQTIQVQETAERGE